MKTYKLTEKQEKIIVKLTEAGFDACWWGRGEIAERIYLNGYRKDVKCWIEFDDPSDLDGAALRVYVEECGQHRNWYITQAQKARGYFVNAFQIVTGHKQAEENPNVITEKEAENLRVGTQVNWLTGGQGGESNPERDLVGVIKSVTHKPAPVGTIGQTEQIEVVIGKSLEDNSADIPLYTWRGILRYGSGAQVVRCPLN
ncbi:MAG: hypothetical protein JXA96_17265 [Sedimentisphaerales bacterium]|nr:hypothetical protein [Sedimentisphaerales bacterium]